MGAGGSKPEELEEPEATGWGMLKTEAIDDASLRRTGWRSVKEDMLGIASLGRVGRCIHCKTVRGAESKEGDHKLDGRSVGRSSSGAITTPPLR